MDALFENILIASFHGSIVILAVLMLRLLLRRMPKKILCWLWLLAGLRLLMPFQIQSQLSLQPDIAPMVVEQISQAQALAPAQERPVSLPEPSASEPPAPAETPGTDWMELLPCLWLAVASGFGVYSLWAYQSVRRRVREAVPITGGWECQGIETAFILGFLRPRIYIPGNLPPYVSRHILAHERTHLEKGDHWIKMVGFLALALHWFNPLVWLAYSCLCKDIELACDERVIRFLEPEERKEYASALLCCSTNRAYFAACPVAFGELSVKGRILAVLDFRRPGFWISAVSLAAVAFVALTLVTSPVYDRATMAWARELELKDVQSIELISEKANAADEYRMVEGPEMAGYIALIRSASGEYFNTRGYVPETQEQMRITLTDGTVHTVGNSGDKYLIIDEDVYTARRGWLATWQLGGVLDPTQERAPSDSRYLRQRWAQDLKTANVARIDLVSQDQNKPFATWSGEDLELWVSRINAMTGEFVPQATIAGVVTRQVPAAVHVFMEDDSRYTIEKIYGRDHHYFSIDGSFFLADEEIFAAWPEVGTGPWPQGYTIAGKEPERKLPSDQITRVDFIQAWDPQPEISRPTGFAAYEWLCSLKAEDIQTLEFLNPNEWKLPYHRYSPEEIRDIVPLLNNNLCYEYAPSVDIQYEGFSNGEFHIQLKDDSWHKVSLVGTTITVVDGTAFHTISSWAQSWPEAGNAPWPEGFEKTLASRDYFLWEGEQSAFSTDRYLEYRLQLDRSYDSDVHFGEQIRYYPLERWGLELSGSSPNATSLMITATEQGSARSGMLKAENRFWLEKWEEGSVTPTQGSYVVMTPMAPPQMADVTILPRQEQQWFLSWADSYGRLEPGFYRVALTFYQEKDGQKGLETRCYVKFSIE